MTTIQIRIDEKTKNSAKKIFDKIGCDMSTAIKLYLKQVAKVKGIPFMLTENGLTLQQEYEIIKASNEARQGKNISKPMTPEEFIKYLKTKA